MIKFLNYYKQALILNKQKRKLELDNDSMHTIRKIRARIHKVELVVQWESFKRRHLPTMNDFGRALIIQLVFPRQTLIAR